MKQPARQAIPVIALVALGAMFWLLLPDSPRTLGPVRWVLLLIAVAIGCVPAVARRGAALIDRLRHPSPRTFDWLTLAVGLLAAAYLLITAINQDRDLFAKTHDEQSYLLQAHMLAHARLWMPAHPLADFFDTFYVIARPVYASLYFPGAALPYTPTAWFGWPTWLLPLAVSGAIVALVYRLTTQLVDGWAGLLAALLVVSLSEFRLLSVLFMSHPPMLLFGLLTVWAYLKWRRQGSREGEAPAEPQATERSTARREPRPPKSAWLAAVGAFAGWAAITRPVDALCYALPAGAALLLDWRGQPLRRWAVGAGLIVAGAMPFLALQLAFNKGVTGSVTQTPYTFYLERDQPRTSFGFRPYDPALQSASAVPQKRDYYRQFMLPFLERHQAGRVARAWWSDYLPKFVDATLPARPLLLLAAPGLLALGARRRWVLWAALPLLLGFYVFNPFFLEHYAVVVAPAVVLSVVLGVDVVAGAFPRLRTQVVTASALAIIAISLASLYELNALTTALDRTDDARRHHAVSDEPFHSRLLRYVHYDFGGQVAAPAVVLFRYAPGNPIIEEPVYNSSVAWPDDAPIIRAHDLGPRNREIFAYYARRQPQRVFWLFDRSTGELKKLGPAWALAAQDATPPTPQLAP